MMIIVYLGFEFPHETLIWMIFKIWLLEEQFLQQQKVTLSCLSCCHLVKVDFDSEKNSFIHYNKNILYFYYSVG